MTKNTLLIAFIIGFTFCLSGCTASINSLGKSINSEITGGIPRQVHVYSYDGKLIKTYTGNIDIESNTDAGITTLMINGKNRVVINHSLVIIEDI